LGNDIATRTLAKVTWRLIPFLGLLYFAAFIDRVNVGFAAPQMNRDLGFSAYVYGLGSGIFFIGYCLFEVPSNLLLHRVGARRWIARIMLTWAALAACMAAVKTPAAFYTLRFLLGVAEAGFFPGIVYYLTGWVPAARRAQLVGLFMVAIPVSTALGGPLSSLILSLDGAQGLAGWQWLFLIETIPSALLGFVVYRHLPDQPSQATWLAAEEKAWLIETLHREKARAPAAAPMGVRAALTNPRVLALSLCYFGIEIALYGVIFWIPQIFKSLGFQEAHLGYWVAIPYLIAAVAMVGWCRHSDRAKERVWHIVAAALAAAIGLACSAWLSDAPALSLLAITVGAAGTLAVLPIFWTLPAALLRGAAAAGAIALINALGNVGGFVGPYVMGWIKDATGGFTYGLLVMAAGALLCAAIALLIGHDATVEHGSAEAAV
jgi:ACS family tartrate transporter-like MFS transporter